MTDPVPAPQNEAIDQFKGFFDWRGDRPDREPSYGLIYLIVFPIVAGIGFAAWLGPSWPALVLTGLTVLLIGGVLVFLTVKRHRRDRAHVPEWR